MNLRVRSVTSAMIATVEKILQPERIPEIRRKAAVAVSIIARFFEVVACSGVGVNLGVKDRSREKL